MTKFRFLLLTLFTALFHDLSATHIIGGQISVVQVGANRYDFTFVGYRNIEGVPFGNGVFDFGDGTTFGGDQDQLPWEISEAENGVEVWRFTVPHTYSVFGDITVSFSEENRSNYINAEESFNVPFYVELQFLVDPFITYGSSPERVNDAFVAVSGERFVSNFRMQDDDGDSLSYRLVTPLQAKDLEITDYKSPGHPDFNDNVQVSFGLDPITANLAWESPGEVGDYSLAIKATEWREVNGQLTIIGETVLDLVIQVLPIGPVASLTPADFRCLPTGMEYQEEVIVQNLSDDLLTIDIETNIPNLLVDEIALEEWLETNQIFSGTQLTMNLRVAEVGENGQFYAVVRVEGVEPQRNLSVIYSSNYSFGVNCRILSVRSVRDDIESYLTANSLVLKGVDAPLVDVSIYSLSGKEHLSGSYINSGGSVNIFHPFISGDVYIVFIQDGMTYTTKKLVVF